MEFRNRKYLTTKDHLVSGQSFDLFFTPEGDMLYTFPRPAEDRLPEYYKSTAYISHTDSKKTLMDRIYRFVKNIALRRKTALITRLNGGPGKLLDVGSGTGDFLLSARSKNWRVWGVEPNTDARERSVEKGVSVVAALDEIDELGFDAITLWHVLEHVPNLDETVTKLRKKLKPGGALVVAVPNFKSLDARYYKEHWAAWDAPRHLWHFSKQAIRRIFLQHGFELQKVKPMWFDAFYISLLSEKYKTGKNRWIRAFFTGLRSNVYGWRKREVSSQVYVMRKQKSA